MIALLMLALGIFFPASPNHAFASEGESQYGSAGEFGLRYHNGAKGKSFTGGIGAFGAFEGVWGKHLFKPNLIMGAEIINGQATVGSSDARGTVFTGGVFPGLDLHFLRDKKWQPFVEVHGIVSWNYASISPVTPKSAETSLALGFGFQAGGGFHIANSNRTKAMRVHVSYQSYSAKLAGQSGFQLNAIGLSLGWLY